MTEETKLDLEFPEDPGCLTLPEDMVEATDFKAEDAIKLDMSVKLPEFFSLGKWIYKTSNQWSLGSCTSMWTSHSVQILNVKKNWVEPTTENIITPDWKDLWSKMGHSTTTYDGWDYVEKAVSTALKQWIKSVPKTTTWWHCIAVVWFDNWGFWFINSWSPNDAEKRKSRFYVSNDVMKKIAFNWRYWILYIKEDAKIDPERLKKINVYTVILETLKKYYNEESPAVKQWIVALSQPLRKEYPEINEKLPL